MTQGRPEPRLAVARTLGFDCGFLLPAGQCCAPRLQSDACALPSTSSSRGGRRTAPAPSSAELLLMQEPQSPLPPLQFL